MKKLGSKKTLPELAVEQIIGYINENGLQPGDQLPNEVDLMNKLKVGRGTIREAIKSLNSKGVVIIKRGIGTFVADQPGISDDPLGFTFETDKTKVLMDALEVRLLIEPQMIIKTIDNISAKQLKELSDLADEIESLINKNKDYTVQDIEFHTYIAKCSRNRVIETLIPVINTAEQTFASLTHRSLMQETLKAHRAIVQAIEKKDPVGAKCAMVMHLTYNRQALCKLMEAEEKTRN